MKTLKTLILAAFMALSAFGQTALTSTTTSAAITVNQTVFSVASATGISVGTRLYVIDQGQTIGELMVVSAISSTRVTVTRTGVNKSAKTSGAYVIIAPVPGAFYGYNPTGSCTAASTQYTPWINVSTGEQWLCSTTTLNWVPGWNNPASVSGTTATLASAAGANTPTGRFFIVSGTNAVTSWTLPVGFAGGEFCTIPSGAYTWTTAGNIGLAGTAVVGRVLCFTWSVSAAKWYPSYV